MLWYLSKKSWVKLFCKVQNLRKTSFCVSVFISSSFCVEPTYWDIHGDTTTATMTTAPMNSTRSCHLIFAYYVPEALRIFFWFHNNLHCSIVSAFYKWEDQGLERLGNSFYVRQFLFSGAKIWTQHWKIQRSMPVCSMMLIYFMVLWFNTGVFDFK